MPGKQKERHNMKKIKGLRGFASYFLWFFIVINNATAVLYPADTSVFCVLLKS